MDSDGLMLDCLPPAQRRLWPHLSDVPPRFILYGGTALALQLGHRQSVDFDFFGAGEFTAGSLIGSMGFLRHAVIEVDEPNTLTVSLPDGKVNVSFMGGVPPGRFQVRDPLRGDNGLLVASVPDVFGCKCVAAHGRAESKDYIDICAILEQTEYSLSDGLSFASAIYGEEYAPQATLRALAYHEDLNPPLSSHQRKILLDAVAAVDLRNLQDPHRMAFPETAPSPRFPYEKGR